MYVPITDPERFAADHLTFCQSLGLKGRILVAAEGINGTVSGTVEQTDEYMKQ
ncbi:rhodanese [Halalkalibacter wakoensis JCM 9140]|uniref:Rhodanese n=1 Tax=Halalkalibacter wakoensis JCM 9140 TaxID=1236970 RepID=W4Q3W5_9BACI|nr:rhodanese [Halalkalibacter wakoensis JCM 9140]